MSILPSYTHWQWENTRGTILHLRASAIDLLNDPSEPTPEDLTKAEGDLLTAIKRLLRRFPTITLKHVRGHQNGA